MYPLYFQVGFRGTERRDFLCVIHGFELMVVRVDVLTSEYAVGQKYDYGNRGKGFCVVLALCAEIG